MSKEKIVTKEEAQKWDRIVTTLQFGSIFALFPAIIILNAVPKADARVVVWWLVIPIGIVATIAFILSHISNRKMSTYLRQEFEAMQKRHNKMLEKFKS